MAGRTLAQVVLSATFAACLNISIPLSAPSNAVNVPRNLFAFSLEQDRWTDWSGTRERNQYFYNTLMNLKDLTGVPPDIRIGANSEDRTQFNPDVEFAETIFPPYTDITPYPEASNVTVGKSYYSTVRFLPRGTRVTWGVNLGSNNLTAAFLETQAIVKTFTSPAVRSLGIRLEFLEIGNEPDLYKNNGLRPSTYNSTQLVADWIRFAENLTDVAKPLFDTGTRWLGGSLAGSSHTLSGFSPQALFAQGLLSSAPGKQITTFSQHRYMGSFCQGTGGLVQELMSPVNIRGNLSQYSPDIAVVHQQGLDYIMGECNSFACHGAPGVSNSAGAAVWAVDFTLFAPTIGYRQMVYHEGIGFKYNLIQPATLTRSILDGSPLDHPIPPHIQPEYYAAIIVNEAIGPSGATKIVELTTNHPRVTGYAFFEHGQLARAVFINSQAYFASAGTPRGTIHIDFDFGEQAAPETMKVKRLAIKSVDDTAGLSWGGQNYETRDGIVSGHPHVEIACPDDGLDISDTEVVLLKFHV